MVKNILKSLVIAAVGVGLAAGAMASTGMPYSTTPAQKITYFTSTNMRGFSYPLPALAQNYVDTLVVNVSQVFSSFVGARV
jgi:hypothetical protein